MRVIAGTARRLILDTPKGLATRPTMDRIKETLFNIINNELPGANFLDLFAGSGAIGIEALSRGCKSAVFVENNREALACIGENLRRTKLLGAAEIMPMDVAGALACLKDGPPFDIIFMDPPYREGLPKKVLGMLAESNACGGDTLVIFEEALGEETAFVTECGFYVVREKCYKTNKHLFVKKK